MSVSKDHYYKLASELPSERIDAATALLSDLSKVDKKEEWDYALTRLIKGLTTTRQSARFGFSMALTEVVRELINKKDHDLTVSAFLNQVLQTSEVKASMKGKEERGVLFGRLFGLQVLLNSELLFNEELSNETVLRDFVNALIDLSSNKSWLRETTVFTLCQFITLYVKLISDNRYILGQILQRINDTGLNMTTEGIAVYLTIPKAIRTDLAARIQNPKSNWKNGDPFSKGNLPSLAKSLKDAEVPSEPEEITDETKPKGKKANNKQKGSWQPRIPFVWDLIVSNFTSSHESLEESEDLQIESSKKRKKSSKSSSKKQKLTTTEDISLSEFWKVVIDETLFSEKSSHERKFWGFEIFTKFLHAVKAEQISSLFTPNFMRCLINQSAQSNRMLNKISVKTLNSISEVAMKDYTKTPEILARLLDEKAGGCWNFDLITKSKVTDTLVGIFGYIEDQAFNESELESVLTAIKKVLIEKFDNAVASQEGDEDSMKKSNDNVQKWVLDKLSTLFRSCKKFDSLGNKWLDDIFKFLVQHAFFKPTSGKGISGNVRKLVQDRLNSFLSETMAAKTKDRSYSTFCIKYIGKLEKSDEFQLQLEFDEELLSIKAECQELLKSIKTLSKISNSRKRDQLDCFELLFAMVLIQLYMGDDETITVLGELKGCYESVFVGAEDDEEVDPAIVLTEVILSFVSRKSSLMKKLSLVVWESFLCSKNEDGNVRLTSECLQLLFNVLEAKENKEGQQKLFDADDEFEAENDDEDEDEDEKEEEKGSESSDGGSDSDNENSESDDDIDVDEDEEDNSPETNVSELDKQTQLKLAQALGVPSQTSGEVKFDDIDAFGDDGEGSSYESDSMDDEQMMAMDDQLAKIFQDRRQAMSSLDSGNKRKKEVMEARDQMIFFKNRILDLLDSFSRINPESLLNLAIIKPVVVLIDLTLDKNLGVKAHKLLKTRLSKTKVTQEEFSTLYPSDDAQTSYKNDLLQAIQSFQDQAGSKSSNNSHSLASSQSCIVVAKNLIRLDRAYLEKVIDVYSESLKKWASNSKNKIQASLFFDFINWLNSKRSDKDN